MSQNKYPWWWLKIPSRPLDLMGMDPRTMQGNDLSKVSDLNLGLQDHDWLTEAYLRRLNGERRNII